MKTDETWLRNERQEGRAHRKPRKRVSLDDAAHPKRQAAIRIIENVIEPLLAQEARVATMFRKKGLTGQPYYVTEDAIVEILKSLR